jgi:hypothetical protein
VIDLSERETDEKRDPEEAPEVARVPTLRPARQKVLTEFIKR